MTHIGYDWSFAHENPSLIAAHGEAAGRYLGGSADKDLTKAEAAELHAVKLGIWLVFEGLANRALAGQAAGVADARSALSQANALGYPAQCPLFFAVDFGANVAQVSAYFAGVRSVLGTRAGIYGGDRLFGLATWHWQAAASSWSDVFPSPAAHIVQHVGSNIAGTDLNVIQRAIPVWGPKGAAIAGPQPTPAAPKPAPVPAAKSLHPNIDEMRAAGLRALKANPPGKVRRAVAKALKALDGIPA